MFTHPADIPVEFALAVHSALHNTATATDWEILDAVNSEGEALDWIERIYEANGQDWSEVEQQWWQAQLGSAPSLN